MINSEDVCETYKYNLAIVVISDQAALLLTDTWLIRCHDETKMPHGTSYLFQDTVIALCLV